MTHTKKKSPSVDVVQSAWDAFFAAKGAGAVSVDDLRTEGWLLLSEFAEKMGMSRRGALDLAKREKLEVKSLRAAYQGVSRVRCFIRLSGS
jgi:hypothetical protein